MPAQQQPPRRIAVVAVHGVANQLPGDTARAVADLLLKQSAGTTASYGPCEETDLRIAVRKMAVPPQPAAEEPKLRRTRFEERSHFVQQLQTAPAARDSNTNDDENGLGFMRTQVQDYRPQGPDSVYETFRLKTTRSESGCNDLEVHVYEMYWADLSRLGGGLLRIVGELYQMLFHFGSVGRHTVDFAWAAHAHDASRPLWHAFQFFVTWSVRLLTLPIPILNLFFLAVVCMPLAGQVFGDLSEVFALLFLALTGGIATVALLLRFERVPWLMWLLSPPAVAVFAAWIGRRVIHPDVAGVVPLSPFQLLAFEWTAIAAVALVVVLRAYDRRRPGAISVGLWLGLTFLLLAVIPQILFARESQAAILDAALKLTELLFLCQIVCWAALIVCEWLAAGSALLAVLATPRGDAAEVSRSVRAAGTACLAVSLPSLLFLLLTLVLYRGLLQLGPHVFPADLQYNPTWLLTKYFGLSTELPAIEFLNKLVEVSATPVFIITLLMIGLTLVMAIWALLPAARYDISPPAVNSQRLARTLGNWLTWGYQLLTFAAVVVFLTFPVLFTAGVAAMLLNQRFRFLPETGTAGLLGMIGTLAVGSVGGLLAFHGRLESIAMGFRPILDTILDVDNHLRNHPYDANPRARISCRYVSLLRYVCGWQDMRDSGRYEGIIIVAHSQGTVISAELLRFLKAFPDADLARLTEVPIYLFTMGCPLRQLYGWRFPHLYAWARHDDESAWTIGQPQFIPADQKPDPRKLGVALWVNAFRSGDYIGRHLWRSDDCDYQWASPSNLPSIQSEDAAGLRREFCIGAGGHNHYFDDTAPEVAVEFDRLIRQMAFGASPDRPVSLLGTECLEPDEQRLIDQIVNVSQRLLNATARPVLRGQHPKQHGCLRATFEVKPGLAPGLAVGLFGMPKVYDAVVRFSNGRETDDTHPDIHGMAIKVFGVPGKKLLDGEQASSTQDFVLIDHPVFFIRNLTDYAPFSQMLLGLQGRPRIWVVLRLFWFFFRRGQMRQFGIVRASRNKRISNPFAVQYWSTTPSRWKDTAVKYSVRPATVSPHQIPPSAGADYLRESMKQSLDECAELCFDFMVQLQEHPEKHPVEDPTVPWDSPWHSVASIRICRQPFTDAGPMQQGENLAFTPWHSLPDHQPLGAINRARKQVYTSISAIRRQLNDVAVREL